MGREAPRRHPRSPRTARRVREGPDRAARQIGRDRSRPVAPWALLSDTTRACEFRARLKVGDVVVVDVRNAAEYEAGHIPGAQTSSWGSPRRGRAVDEAVSVGSPGEQQVTDRDDFGPVPPGCRPSSGNDRHVCVSTSNAQPDSLYQNSTSPPTDCRIQEVKRQPLPGLQRTSTPTPPAGPPIRRSRCRGRRSARRGYPARRAGRHGGRRAVLAGDDHRLLPGVQSFEIPPRVSRRVVAGEAGAGDRVDVGHRDDRRASPHRGRGPTGRRRGVATRPSQGRRRSRTGTVAGDRLSQEHGLVAGPEGHRPGGRRVGDRPPGVGRRVVGRARRTGSPRRSTLPSRCRSTPPRRA